MAFHGKTFVFNSVPCEAYELELYNIGSTGQGGGEFASIVSVEEEVVGNRWKPYFYGTKYEEKLELEMIFGVNQRRLDEEHYLDRFEIDAIATWLTGHEEYLWLEVDQDDMRHCRYHCMCSGLSIISYGRIPTALQATFVCDSPYAYLYPRNFTYTISGTTTINFFNESSINGYYYPDLEIVQNGGTFSIKNVTDNNRVFSLTGYPASATHVYVDNDHGVITDNQDLNLYPYFNYKFFRLKKGFNQLQITGSGTLIIKCAFPVNAGG